jgi:SAM-dependent methyltransferase
MSEESGMQNPLVHKNHFGFYELTDKPSQDDLKKYYAEKYYQQSLSTYQQAYSEEEIAYIRNKLEQKCLAAGKLLAAPAETQRSFLDVGAGEGWALAYFRAQGWHCTGLDYSEYGCRTHNPDCVADLMVGDIYENIDKLVQKSRKFDLVLLDNVLEHVPDPLSLLTRIRGLTALGGVLIIEVPNDFSVVQQHLLDNGYISRSFWIAIPDHISYFNRDGLTALCDEAGWRTQCVLGDFPIDFSLFNESTNYVENKSAGKSCHRVRVAVENLMHAVSPEKTNVLYEALADLGMGRQLIGFFQEKPGVGK